MTAHPTADLLEIQPNMAALFYKKIRQVIIYPLAFIGFLGCINDALVRVWRQVNFRCVYPHVGVIDSQSVKTTKAGGKRGFNVAKKIKGRKHHIITNPMENLLEAIVHSADIQDRDDAPLVRALFHNKYPCGLKIYADGGYVDGKLEKCPSPHYKSSIGSR